MSLGDLLHTEGQHEQAVAAYERSIALAEQIGDGYTQAVGQASMAPALVALGRIEEALSNGLEAFIFFNEKGFEPGVQGTAKHLRELKTQVGEAAFDAAWQAVDGGPQPEWLQDTKT